MPELPEVESVRKQLDPELASRRVLDAWWDPLPSVPREFIDPGLLIGRTIERVGRRGKFLIAPLDAGLELILHLGMTGSFRFDEKDAYARAGISLDDGRELVF
ncbi:MAG: DNA-formamidopyrimidine glycosylase family protein, partial [Actinomycetota bacterium]